MLRGTGRLTMTPLSAVVPVLRALTTCERTVPGRTVLGARVNVSVVRPLTVVCVTMAWARVRGLLPCLSAAPISSASRVQRCIGVITYSSR